MVASFAKGTQVTNNHVLLHTTEKKHFPQTRDRHRQFPSLHGQHSFLSRYCCLWVALKSSESILIILTPSKTQYSQVLNPNYTSEKMSERATERTAVSETNWKGKESRYKEKQCRREWTSASFMQCSNPTLPLMALSRDRQCHHSKSPSICKLRITEPTSQSFNILSVGMLLKQLLKALPPWEFLVVSISAHDTAF